MSTANASQAAFAYTWATRLVLFAAFFGLITSFNGFFIAATRVIFASGRGGLLPKSLGKVEQKHRTPKNAILFVGLITLFGPFIGKSSLLPMVNIASLAFISGWFISMQRGDMVLECGSKIVLPITGLKGLENGCRFRDL